MDIDISTVAEIGAMTGICGTYVSLPKLKEYQLPEEEKYTFQDLLKEIPEFGEDWKHLDVGTCDGICIEHYLSEAKERLEDIDYHDLRRNSIGLDKDRYLEDNFVYGDARDLPFSSDSFDVVTLGKILQYFEDGDVDCVLDETERVLKESGYTVGDVPINGMDILWPVKKVSEGKKVDEYREKLEERFDLLNYETGWDTDPVRGFTKSICFVGQK